MIFFGKPVSTFPDHALGGSLLLAVGLEPRINQRDLCIDRGVAQAFLLGDKLHEFIGGLDIGRTVL